MKMVIGGAVAVVLGLAGLTFWFYEFLQMMAGIIPMMLLLGSALVIYHRFDEIGELKNIWQKRAPEEKMNWFLSTVKSSLGLKLLMALTGLSFCGFLTVHLAGNLSMYGGKEMFNSYAEHLHALGVLLIFAEWGLLILAVIHIVTGLTLFYQNLQARPVRYKVNKNAGGRSIGSMTMPYTGVVLLVFIVIHLLNFHFVDKTDTTIFDIVSAAFAKPGYVIFYVAAVVLAAVHVSHGFWSAFQTLGANHPKYMPLIRVLSLVFAVAVGVGFGLLPIYISISA